MKRLLSILLALSLIISIIPAASAADGEATSGSREYNLYDSTLTSSSYHSFKTATKGTDGFTIERDFEGTTYYLNDEFWGSYGNRGWKLFDASAAMMATDRFRLATTYMQVGKSAEKVAPDFTLSLQAPEKSGFFIPSMKGGSASTGKVITWSLAVFPSEESIPESYKVLMDKFFSGALISLCIC